jgi:hypothetical protein
MGFNGSTSSAPVVMLDLLFLKRAFRGRYLVTEEGHGVMGRDILNYLALLLDGAFVDWLKSSSLMEGFDEILLPGEPESRTRRQREADGVFVDEPTWQQMTEAAAKLGIELG